uniref:Uncharacterized protein n=1 Tax=Arundo donax TaxID=35708 RepID=A0A0A9ATB8_ARUDO
MDYSILKEPQVSQ